jgi:glycosyltransferase involved in cell wall biosynthesis
MILKSCGTRSWGGLEIYMLRTIDELNKIGQKASLLCMPNSALQKNANIRKITTFPILNKGIGRISSILKLKNIIKTQQVDVIHTHLSNDLWILVPAIKLSGRKTKLILTKGMASGVNKKDIFHRYLYKKVDRIIAVSNFLKKNVLETCPVNESKVEVINDAVSLEKFNPELYDKDKVRGELGLDTSSVVIGMVGRMSPGKGYETLFESAKMIMGNYPDKNIKFLVVGAASFGEDKYEKELMNIVKENKLEQIIKFAGFQDDIAYFYSAMDILAFPSNEESFGGTLLEAMAMKLPVAASDSGGVPDIVINNETGFLVPRNNPTALTGGLMKLVNDEKLRITLGSNCRKRVEEHFEMTKNMKIFEKIYGE